MASESVTKIFRRIICDPAILDGRPHIKKGRKHILPVEEIVERLREGRSLQAIREEFGKMSDRDFILCRAWQARFAPGTLSKEFNRAVNPENVIMLDENIDYGILYDTVKLFGRSSHVTADGLYDEHNNDEKDIWAHLVAHKYKAIVTADSDFTRISRRLRRAAIEKYGSIGNCPEHMPVVIHVLAEGRSILLKLLKQSRDEILAFIEKPDAAYADLGLEGLARRHLDFSYTDAANDDRTRNPNPRTHPSSGPSQDPAP